MARWKPKLTVISAPAGFGKTTLLAEWLAVDRADERPVAWLSLDQDDNPARVLLDLLDRRVADSGDGVGARTLSPLQGPQPPRIETVLATVINELTAVPNDVVLVLDDCHVIDAHEIDDGVALLLEHLPPRVHLLITTRADPELPHASLRARRSRRDPCGGRRFTSDEAAAYLNDVMRLDLAGRSWCR